MRYREVKVWILAVVLIAVLAGASSAAKVVARVDGDPITDEEVSYVAVVSVGAKEGDISKEDMGKALAQAMVNHKVYQLVQKEKPELLPGIERAADLLVARDYFRAWMADFGQVEAMKTVTPTAIAETLPLPDPLVFLYVLVMQDEAKLKEVREEIVSGKITFEEAARKYSQGLTAKAGGQVGGVNPGDDRFSEQARKDFFAAEKGTVTQPYKEALGYNIYWVKDKRTAEEFRLQQAHEQLEKKIREEMNRLGWEASKKHAAETGSVLYVNDANAGDFEKEIDRPVMKIGGTDYQVKDVLSRSGGKIHGKKDILTISENVFRDMMLTQLYVEAKGAKEQIALRRKAMVEHYATRSYFGDKTDKLDVSDSEVEEYLKSKPGKYDLPDRIDLGMIFVKTEQRRDIVVDRLKVEDFETVAKAWGQHKKFTNGRVGVVPVSQFSGDKTQLKPGTVLEPKKMGKGEDEGWYVLKVFDFIPAQKASVKTLGEETLGGIRSIVMSRKKEKTILPVVEKLMKEAKTEILM